MLFDFTTIPARECYKLLVSTVTPRPIAWIVSQDAKGVNNAAPFSFFNAFAGDPPVVGIGIGSRRPGQAKDSRANIQETGQFVVNLVSEENAEKMNITSIEFDSGVDEIAEAGLTALPSVRVKPPRIAESPVAMECELMQIVELGESGLVLGRVVAMHVRDDLVLGASKHYTGAGSTWSPPETGAGSTWSPLEIDTPKMKLIGRMHGSGWYARTSFLFQMPRIRVDARKK